MFDVGIISARDARLYTIFMENGTHVSQNRIDLKWTDTPVDLKSQDPIVSSNAKSKYAPPRVPNSNVKCMGKAKLTEKRVEVRKSNLTNSCMYTT